jgi:hypothetical protein
MPGEGAKGLDLQYDGSKTQSRIHDAVQHIESCGNPRTVPSSILRGDVPLPDWNEAVVAP